MQGKQIYTGNCSVAIEELEVGKKCVVKQKDGVIDESNKNKVRGCTNGRRSWGQTLSNTRVYTNK